MKRTKTKSLEAQTSVTEKKKKEFKILGFSTLTGKWDRDRELIIANEIPNLEALFTLAWLPSLALIIRWMEQTSNLRLWK